MVEIVFKHYIEIATLFKYLLFNVEEKYYLNNHIYHIIHSTPI